MLSTMLDMSNSRASQSSMLQSAMSATCGIGNQDVRLAIGNSYSRAIWACMLHILAPVKSPTALLEEPDESNDEANI